MYLPRDRETFKGIIEQAADSSERTPAVVEKDYFVTLILKLLSEQLNQYLAFRMTDCHSM